MHDLCTQFWPCYALAPREFWPVAFIMPVLMIILVGIPTANILHRAGRSRWWTILIFIPFVNLIGLWVFAFARWPKLAA